MAEGSYWFVLLVGGVVGFFLSIVLNHFLPLFFKGDLVPKGTFGWPLLGETFSFLKPHSSNSVGAFLQDHCSRYECIHCIIYNIFSLNVDFTLLTVIILVF